MRVYELAKQVKMSNDDLIALLRKAGFEVKSHMSGVTDEMVAAAGKKAGKVAAPKAKAKAKTSKAKVKAAPKAAPKAKASKAASKTAPSTAKAASKTAPSTAKAASKTAPSTAKAASKAAPSTTKAAPTARAKPSTKPPAGRPARPADKRPAHGKPAPASGTAQRQGRKGGKARRSAAADAQQKAVRESVRRTLAKIETTRRTKRRKGKPRDEKTVEETPLKVSEGTTVRELAASLKLDTSDILKRCEGLGLAVTADEILDKDAVELISEDIGRAVNFVSDEVEELLRAETQIDKSRLAPRAPIVTVMGHVDHGKTSILDYIRKTRVASGEAGGITQHIGAYEVETPNGKITFIDTPGHEAFTSMRARGARVTDIVVLVVAADDGVMPQTIEAINHAKAAEVPVIVAINKIDLAGTNPGQIKQQLAERDVIVEEFGGDVVAVEVSAKTGQGIDKLLEMILLQAELLELKADPGASAQGVAVEVKKEEGRGVLCTVLVTQGTLKVGDVFVIGSQYGKVRALLDHRGKNIKAVGPSIPVLVLGTNGVPEAGDRMTVVKGEREARELSMKRQDQQKVRERRPTTPNLTLEELYEHIQRGELKELRLIVKGDTNGTVEALTENLSKLTVDDVVVKVLHSGVGVVAESDVLLATSSEALIIGFNVKIAPKAQELAQREKVEIKTYSIIYEVIEEVEKALTGMLEPERVERVLGRAEVRKVFQISRLGQIAGSYVIDGEITRNAQARVIRGDEVIYEGRITSLKRFQDDVRGVQSGFECGIGVGDFGRLQEGDIVEAFVIEEKARAY